MASRRCVAAGCDPTGALVVARGRHELDDIDAATLASFDHHPEMQSPRAEFIEAGIFAGHVSVIAPKIAEPPLRGQLVVLRREREAEEIYPDSVGQTLYQRTEVGIAESRAGPCVLVHPIEPGIECLGKHCADLLPV